MTYGSLFAGAGGFDLGLDRAGLRCLWQVEIDPTANAVRQRHWPGVERFRDVTGFSRIPKRHGHWLTRWERPDVIVGGFPCQDLSIAGKRAGLQGGARSGLWWQMLRIIRGLRPRYVVWENVPGLLISDSGRDLARILDSLADSGYYGAYRVLDAQHFGAPQRRRRVFGVFACGHLGTERCAEILALSKSVRRGAQEGRATGEGVTSKLGTGAARSGSSDREGFIVGPLMSGGTPNGHGSAGVNNQHAYSGHLVPIAFDWTQAGNPSEMSPTRSVGTGKDIPSGPVVLASCLTCREGKGPASDATSGNEVAAGGVRRLTPRECERLMSWPDDWTRWDDRGRELKDGPRYRLCGNGVVSNVAEWIGRRMMEFA